MTVVSQLSVELGADTRQFENNMRGADDRISNFASQNTERLTRFATGAAAAITGAAIGMGTAATMMAIEWESAFADVEKTVSGTPEEIEALEDALRAMATSDVLGGLENAHSTLAQIAASAGQLGVATEDIDTFTETIAALTVATNMTADEAATFAARFANITGMDIATEMDNLGDTIVTLGNNMATTESEIAAFANRLASLSVMGFDEADILGLGAAMSSLGISAELGGTNLLKTVSDITTAVATGGTALQTYAEVAGMTAAEFTELNNLNPGSGLQAFLTGLSELDASAQIMTLQDLGIASAEQQRVLMTMAGGLETVNEALEISQGAWAGNGAAMNEAATRSETTQGKLNRMNNALRDLGITIGANLAPTVAEFAESMTEIMTGNWVEGLNRLGGAARDIVDSFGDMFGLDIAGTMESWEQEFGSVGNALWVFIMNGINNAAQAATDLGNIILLSAVAGLNSAAQAATDLGNILALVVMNALNTASQAATNLGKIILLGAVAGFNALTGIGPSILAWFQDGIEYIVSNPEAVVTGISDFITGGVSAALEAIPNMLTGIDTFFSDLIAGLFGGGGGETQSAQITDAINETIVSAIPTDPAASILDAMAIVGQGIWEGLVNSILMIQDSGIADVLIARIQSGLSGISGLLGLALAPIGQAFSVIWDNIGRTFEAFVLDFQITMLGWVADLRNTILDLTSALPTGAVDIAPDVAMDLSNLTISRENMNIADQITGAINESMANGDLDLSQGIEIAEGFSLPLSDVIKFAPDPAALAEAFGAEGRQAVQEALTMAIAEGDEGAIEVLTPLAMELDIDMAAVQSDARDMIEGGTYDATIQPMITVDPIWSFPAMPQPPMGGGMVGGNGSQPGFNQAAFGSGASGGSTGGSSTTNITLVGTSPYAANQMVQQANRDAGYP